MKISDMEAILKVIQQGGLAPAAELLFLSQPALSQIIRRVESELGITLFIRRPGKNFELTNEGHQFAEAARKITCQYQDYLQTLAQSQPPLRIGISSHYGNRIVQAISASDPAFSPQKYDFIEINSNRERELAVHNHALDFATSRAPLTTTGLLSKIIYREKLGIWLRNGSPVESLAITVPGEKYRTLPLSALNHEPLALPSASSRMYLCIKEMLRLNQIIPSVTDSFSSMSYILLMVEQGEYNTISRFPNPNQKDERFFLMTPCDQTYDLVIAYHPESKRLSDIERVSRILSAYYTHPH